MALDATIKVNTEILNAKAQEVRAAADKLNQCFTDIRNLVNGTGSFWIGDAADAHRTRFAKQQTALDEILARYREHVTDLERIAGIYSEAETANKAKVADLASVNV